MVAQSLAFSVLALCSTQFHAASGFAPPQPLNIRSSTNQQLREIPSHFSAAAPSVSSPRSKTSLNVAGLEGVWTSYLSALESDPLLVKSITAGVILGAADLSGQAIQQAMTAAAAEEDGSVVSTSSSGVDLARFARFAFFGFILQAPWNHFYYQILDGALPPTEDPFTATTGIKVAIDQFVQAPIFTVIIFGFLGVLEGKSTDEIKKQLDDDYVDTMLANWKLWVPATAVNIAFCPPILRVLFLNCADKSTNVISDDESIPPSCTPVMSEDAFLKGNGAACIPCIVPFDEESVPPYPQSAERSDLKNKSKRLHQNCQTLGEKSKEMMRVFIPPELEPAQRVKVRYPNGTTLRTAVPPRSKWLYKTCNGRIRSFFVVPIPPDLAQKALHPSSQHNQQSSSRPTRDGGRRSTKSQKVQFFTTPSKH